MMPEPHSADVATMVRRTLRRDGINLVGHVDPSLMKEQVMGLPASMWNNPAWRTRMPNSPHCEASDILLRFQDMTAIRIERALRRGAGLAVLPEPNDVLDTIAYPAWWELDACRRAVYDLARRWFAVRLGRVMVTSLGPGKKIYPHSDLGLCAEYYDRFQIMLETNEKTFFTVDGCSPAAFRAGDVFWFDNRRNHAVENNGETTRIALIIDLEAEDYGDGWREPQRNRVRPDPANPGAG